MLEEMGITCWQPSSQTVQKVISPTQEPRSLGALGSSGCEAPAPAPAPALALAVPSKPLSTKQQKTEIAPPLPQADSMDWAALHQAVNQCQACGLCQGRTQAVLGMGSLTPSCLVIGEAPGEQEDKQGMPFVGPSGQLLDNMLRSVGLNRQDTVYIANVLKCRPPGNRNPLPEETVQCEPYLRRQIALLQPQVIMALGRFAAQSLLHSNEPVGRLRGKVHTYQSQIQIQNQSSERAIPVVVSYHPAYLLRNLPDKAKAWADWCLLRTLI
jgi:DNA polymerase